jgi:hypothetical protein
MVLLLRAERRAAMTPTSTADVETTQSAHIA